RQSSIATRLWSLLMSRKLMLASSALATLLIVPAAGYVTVGMINNGTISLTDAPALDTRKDDEARLRREKPDASDGRADADAAKPDPYVSEPAPVDAQSLASAPRTAEEPFAATSEVAETEADALALPKPATVQPYVAKRQKTLGG